MKPATFIEIMAVAEKLKCNTRHSWTSNGRHESVAEHSWRLALMAMLVRDEYPELDMDKVIKMCIIHDLGETFTGDIPSFEKKEADEKKESEVLNKWIATFPQPYKDEFSELYREMKERTTKEAMLYKALDNLEAVIQHDEADISTWLPLEYDLQLVYGADKVGFSEYTQLLKQEIDQKTRHKIETEGTHTKAE